MFIRGLIQPNFEKLAEAVLIAIEAKLSRTYVTSQQSSLFGSTNYRIKSRLTPSKCYVYPNP